ncbi:MobA/MobL family protein, partial [Escherichia coli]|nr:MobA/MobL family protein [Escherichia coli]
EWARDNPSHFWQAADQFERANGSTYRELEIALPRELTPEQRLELVQDFVRQEAGERHAWSFAIHNPKASIDGGEQPHAHIMMSQRVNE